MGNPAIRGEPPSERAHQDVKGVARVAVAGFPRRALCKRLDGTMWLSRARVEMISQLSFSDALGDDDARACTMQMIAFHSHSCTSESQVLRERFNQTVP